MTTFGIIALAALLSGVLDLAATSTLMRFQGISFERLLQTIASGALGSSAFRGKKRTAVAGLSFHFLIAFSAAAAYYTISREASTLLDHPLLGGLIFGTAVHLVMSRIVVPLSAAPKREFSTKAFLIQLVIHILFVGLPISITVSQLAS
jgi:hypothetical protein